MAYKRLEDSSFTWPAIRDGVMTLSHAQFEALFAGLDWRRVRALFGAHPHCGTVNRRALSAGIPGRDLFKDAEKSGLLDMMLRFTAEYAYYFPWGKKEKQGISGYLVGRMTCPPIVPHS